MRWKSLKEALLDIQKRPGMFFKEKTVYDLMNFMSGYQFALSIHSISDDKLFDESVNFHDWVALRTHFYESTSGWVSMLSDYYKSDELAFDMFFVHLHEYKNRKGRVIKYIYPTQSTKWKTQTIDGSEFYIYLTPIKIEVVKYTDDPGMFVRYLDGNNELIESERYALDEDGLRFALIGIPIESSEWIYESPNRVAEGL